jgi:hypothetical protein
MRFLSLTIQEAMGKIPFKDYTWNATYIYKWTYAYHQLSKYPWYRRWLDQTQSQMKTHPSLSARIMACLSGATYTMMRYAFFWQTILYLPVLWVKRIGVYWECMNKRLQKRIAWPVMLETDGIETIV